MSFAAIAQFAPAFFGGLIWRGANARGAIARHGRRHPVWAYTLLFPSLASPGNAIIVLNGLFGIEALRPQALFGTVAEPLNHGVIWSLSINALFFVLRLAVARLGAAGAHPGGDLRAARHSPMPSLRRFRTAVTVNDLKDTIGALSRRRAHRTLVPESFEIDGRPQAHGSEPANMDVVRFSEQLLASAVGSSSARLVLSLLFKRNDSSARDAFRLLDDATEALQHNRDLLQIALDQMEQGITVFDRISA
jgi:hypothetical protein